MVFPGHFSTGCMRCRQRKVKCDEAKPTCRRCHIYGKPCPGYTDQFHFRYARKKDYEKVSVTVKEPSERRDSQSSQQGWDSNDNFAMVTFQAPITPPPTPSYEDVSLCYFVRRFVTPDMTDGFPGHLSFLPCLYNQHNPGLLEMATQSVAQMAAYNQFGDPRFSIQAYKSYGRAIQMMQDVIDTENGVTDDRVIATILLFCAFRDITGEGHGDPGEHAPGLFYILERRGPAQIGTRIGAEVFFLALLRLQIYSFLHNDNTYSDPGAIATVLGMFDPLLRALSMMSKTLSLRQALLQHLSSEVDQVSEIFPSDGEEEDGSVIQRCIEMLNEFYTWDTEAAEYWQSTFEGRGAPMMLGEVASGSIFYDAETACTIILVRSARLILLLSILLYHGMMNVAGKKLPGNSDAWAEFIPFLELDVGKTIDDILACVPYALGDIGPNGRPGTMSHEGASGIVIVNSIKLVTYCAYTNREQLQKARATLNRINKAIGIRSATGWVEDALDPQWAQDQNLLRSMFAVSPSPSDSPPICSSFGSL